MASSIVHLAITSELARRISFKDTNRLKFGSIVVDAGVGGNKNGNSHMKINVQDGRKKTYDFDRYREMKNRTTIAMPPTSKTLCSSVLMLLSVTVSSINATSVYPGLLLII